MVPADRTARNSLTVQSSFDWSPSRRRRFLPRHRQRRRRRHLRLAGRACRGTATGAGPVSINAKEAGMGNSVTADPGNLPGTADPTLSAGDTSPAGPAIKPKPCFRRLACRYRSCSFKDSRGLSFLSRRIRRSCVLPPADVMRTINKVRRELRYQAAAARACPEFRFFPRAYRFLPSQVDPAHIPFGPSRPAASPPFATSSCILSEATISYAC